MGQLGSVYALAELEARRWGQSRTTGLGRVMRRDSFQNKNLDQL